MKTITKHLMMAAVALLLTTACSNEHDERNTPETEGKLVQFEMTLGGVNSRTVTGTDAGRTTTWVEGDAVGIFAFKRGETSAPVATNAKYVLTGDKWLAAAGSEIYATESQAYDYYAYYPHTAGVTNPAAVSIAAIGNQSPVEGVNYGLSDVMASQNKDVEAGAATIPLLFKHLFAMVEVKVTGEFVTRQPEFVVLKGVKLGATLDIMAATPAATVNTAGETTDVTMYYLAKAGGNAAVPFSYRAVVPAQTIVAGSSLVGINNVNEANKNFVFQYSADVSYEAGKFRQINVHIGMPKPSIEIPQSDMTIDPWGESDLITGVGSEVIVPVTSITLPITMGMEIKDMAAHSVATALSGDTDFWWHRERLNLSAPVTAVTVVEDEGVAVIKASNGAAVGAWSNASFGFHSTSLFETGSRDEVTGVGQRYVLSLKVKSNLAKAGAVVAIRTTGDDAGFQCLNANGLDLGRNMTYATPAAVNTWQSVSVEFNFAQKNPNMAVGNMTVWTPTEDADVKGVNVYIYHNGKSASVDDPACDLFIKDIMLSKYVAP